MWSVPSFHFICGTDSFGVPMTLLRVSWSSCLDENCRSVISQKFYKWKWRESVRCRLQVLRISWEIPGIAGKQIRKVNSMMSLNTCQRIQYQNNLSCCSILKSIHTNRSLFIECEGQFHMTCTNGCISLIWTLSENTSMLGLWSVKLPLV